MAQNPFNSINSQQGKVRESIAEYVGVAIRINSQ